MKIPWINGVSPPAYPPLRENITRDVCVIGGGITGITTAYLLQCTGLKVALLERHKIASGVTAYSTGHLTSLVDIHYYQAISRFSKEAARNLYQGTRDSRALVQSLIAKHGFDVDYQQIPGYYYATTDKQEKRLEKEAEALQQLGVEIHHQAVMEYPLNKYRGFSIGQQASFDALAFCRGLAKAFTTMGGEIFEQSGVVDFESNGDFVDAICPPFTVKAKYLLQATHTPLKINPLQLELRSFNSYAVVGEPGQSPPPGLFYDFAEPYHYSRAITIGGKRMWMIGGSDSKTGSHGDEALSLRKLRKYAKTHFQVATTGYGWSNMFFSSADGLPFVGADPVHRNCFLATGYGGDGLTYGILSAMINTTLISGHDEHPLTALFNPSRLKLKSLSSIAHQGVDTFRHLIRDRINLDGMELDELKPGEGKVLHINGEKLGIYINDDGEIFPVNPVCTHMKCLLEWNHLARTWDCGCHGSRFDIKGNVISGPATVGLFEGMPLTKLKDK